jgi:hypothetical protein
MRNRPPLIHNEEMLANIIGISILVFLLKGGWIFIILMFTYFFICEYFERKKYKKLMKRLKEEGSIFYKN